jgi:6-phosphogluconolactonase
MPSAPEIRILKSSQGLYEAAAVEFATQALAVVHSGRKFTVALSGGSTPRSLFTLLATKPGIPWDKVCFFWGDERHVPPTDPESNYRMANEALLSKIPATAENIFRIRAEEKDAATAAHEYERVLKKFFQLSPGELPRFDMILLGLGTDGHTASLFPASLGLAEGHRLVIANWVEKFKTHRLTFTFPVLNDAACVIFLVSGSDKAPIVREALENSAAHLPSQQVRPSHGRLLWLLDSAAASALSTNRST